MVVEVRRSRSASPERWQRALERAVAGNVQVRQLASSGAWVASSASDPTVAYEVEIANGVVYGCSCPAAMFGNDEVCCHRAMAWHLLGVLDPEPPAPALVYSGTFAGKQRTVTVVERTYQRGVWDIVDYTNRQKLGAGGSLDFVRNRLHEAGFKAVATTATVAA